MALSRHLATCVALLLAAGSAMAQPHEGEWVSYRDAYRAMVVFEKYGKPKHFLQNHYQVMVRDKNVSAEGLRLTLSGAATQLNLPLDPTGRAVLPLLKAAYDENAALVLNRRAGQFVFRPRVTVAIRADGVYEASDLRAACAQALGYARYVDPSARAQQCVGLRFVFARQGGQPNVRVRDAGQAALPVQEGAPFADDPAQGFRLVLYRFAEWPGRGQVVTEEAPLAIAPMIE